MTPSVKMLKENASVTDVVQSARREISAFRRKSPSSKRIPDSDHLARLKTHLV